MVGDTHEEIEAAVDTEDMPSATKRSGERQQSEATMAGIAVIPRSVFNFSMAPLYTVFITVTRF